MANTIKGKVDLKDMKTPQALDWLESLFNKYSLNEPEDEIFKDIIEVIRKEYMNNIIRIRKQNKVIDYAIEKLTKKDNNIIIKILLENGE